MSIISKDSLDKAKQYWLNDAKNLVTSLSKFYGDIKLDKISQKITHVIPLEARLLGVNDALVRQVTLSNSDKTFVFARTIVPKNTYNYFTQELESLGTKPIGDNLLFDKSKFDRDEFIIRQLSTKDFHQETGRNTKQEIFSRSSIFIYKNDKKLKLLITEYFLILPEQYYA
ncbi:chorismate--pyruvate lyase [Francisella halioticida]|uniref:Chorismate--pyruvate lyase n=1 Tax=Francisella halioticida TaxID=549298 RepID=A0ABM6M1D3_9GAMM|nr:chorismate lyase [Francisella halioticida]ASG68662.1 chorismate--pyruvate lyase [Francisella halioticida]BCD91587.1 chorismate--pyruvate lyase [Francisella halioticida]